MQPQHPTLSARFERLRVRRDGRQCIDLPECGRLRSQQRIDLIMGPNISGAFFAVDCSILRGVETTCWCGHISAQVGAHAFRDPLVEGTMRDSIGPTVQREQLRVVVEHLFEMWDRPGALHAVPMEAAPELVVDAAISHRVQRARNEPQCVGVASALVVGEHQLEQR